MIDHLDHLVFTTIDRAACIDFYTSAYVRDPDLNLIEISELMQA